MELTQYFERHVNVGSIPFLLPFIETKTTLHWNFPLLKMSKNSAGQTLMILVLFFKISVLIYSPKMGSIHFRKMKIIEFSLYPRTRLFVNKKNIRAETCRRILRQCTRHNNVYIGLISNWCRLVREVTACIEHSWPFLNNGAIFSIFIFLRLTILCFSFFLNYSERINNLLVFLFATFVLLCNLS